MTIDLSQALTVVGVAATYFFFGKNMGIVQSALGEMNQQLAEAKAEIAQLKQNKMKPGF